MRRSLVSVSMSSFASAAVRAIGLGLLIDAAR